VLHKRLPLLVVAAPPRSRAPGDPARLGVFDLRDRTAEAGRAPAVRAVVVCRFFRAPAPVRRPGERLLVSVGNGGDAAGERAGRRLTCPAEWAHDLRDLAAAAFADRPGRVSLNARLSGGAPRPRSLPLRVPWVRLSFNADLVSPRPARTASARCRDLRTRLAALLTLWCRVEGWT
jgi:hypothetical protein